MKALSIRQPWALLILIGVPEMIRVPAVDDPSLHTLEISGRFWRKDIENRSWPLPKNFTLPQRIYVHASLRVDDCIEALSAMGIPPAFTLMGFSPVIARRGALVGEVDITGCITESDSPWFTGPYGFSLANPELYEEPIPCKGKQGFWEVEL